MRIITWSAGPRRRAAARSSRSGRSPAGRSSPCSADSGQLTHVAAGEPLRVARRCSGRSTPAAGRRAPPRRRSSLSNSRAGAGAVDQRVVGVHDALGVAGRARGEEHRRDVVGPRLARPRASKKPGCAGAKARAGARRSASSDARPAARSGAGRAGRRSQMRSSCGHCARISSSLSTCSWSSATAKRDLGVVDREHASRRPPRPGTAAPGSRRATARRASPRRGAAGSSPIDDQVLAALQPGLRAARRRAARTSSASARPGPASARCRIPSRAAPGVRAAAAACSSSRRGKVVSMGRRSSQLATEWPDARTDFDAMLSLDDNPRESPR